MQLARLFRHFAGLLLDGVAVEPEAITLTVRRTAATAACPACPRRSHRVHSQYDRCLRDEPLGGRQVTVRWRVRRFRCANRRCLRRTFAEQAPRLTRRYARHSVPCRASLEEIGLALGGRPAERLCRGLHRASSRMTLLRLVQALPLPATETPQVLGVETGRSGRAAAMARSSWIRSSSDRLLYCLIVRRRRWRPGYSSIRAWRSPPATAPGPTPTVFGRARPRRSK